MGQAKPIRPTAIVVEDDDIQREMLALLLEESNFEVLQCEDAETAALALKARHPSLVVTDINLVGKMDGVELTHLARQRNANIRIIVISGRPLPRPLPPGAKFFAQAGLSDGAAGGRRPIDAVRRRQVNALGLSEARYFARNDLAKQSQSVTQSRLEI